MGYFGEPAHGSVINTGQTRMDGAAFAAFLLPEYRPVHEPPFEQSKMVKVAIGCEFGCEFACEFLALHKRKVAIGCEFGCEFFVLLGSIQGYKLPFF
jgi:hypothetical protein